MWKLSPTYPNLKDGVSISVGKHIFGVTSLCYCLLAGVGGDTPDIGHGLNLLTSQVAWNATHNLGLLFGWIYIASVAGLIAGVVLRGKV